MVKNVPAENTAEDDNVEDSPAHSQEELSDIRANSDEERELSFSDYQVLARLHCPPIIMYLIGDDEHCWSENGVSNIEGGCYAKCIDLVREKKPDIWNAIKFGTVVENVVFDEHTREVDYSDRSVSVSVCEFSSEGSMRDMFHNFVQDPLASASIATPTDG
ncbi:hypothetical protein POM88_010232 [Heracleum sosnowskyi]|uniref:Uncharacterized protein n=1 Tax=Heracleum sosnowskyi TaxID=360622 RepID=A0AAD8N898_9APIA|nr:hypothetical protein POM88_010232 [Heracleum sosnowskyi]